MSKNKDREEPRAEEVREERGEERAEESCPFCCLLRAFEGQKKRHADFYDHLRRAEGEVLRALRSLLDDRLKACEAEEKKGRQATKIKVD